MSRGLVCDSCGAVLIVNHHGEDEAGESAAWLKISADAYTWDACTRVCAHTLIDGEIAEVVDAHAEVIAGIARTIRDERSRPAEDDA